MMHGRVLRLTGLFLAVSLVEQVAALSVSKMWSKKFGSGCENGEIAPAGKTIAVGIEDGSSGIIYFLNVSDGNTIKKMTFVKSCDQNKDSKCNEIESMAWSGDGKYIAAGGNNQPVKTFEVSSGDQVFSRSTRETDGMRASPNGKYFAIANHSKVMVVDIPGFTVRSDVSAHSCGINSVDFTPDSRTMVTGACDKKVIVWNVPAFTKRHTLSAPNSVKTTRITPDGRYILGACSDASVVVLWSGDGQKLKEVPVPGYIDHAEFSPDGTYFVSQGKGRDLLFYSVPAGNKVLTFGSAGDGEYMHWKGERLLVCSSDGLVSMFRVTTGGTALDTPTVPVPDPVEKPFDAFGMIEAEEYHAQYGTQIENGHVGYFDDGDFLRYKIDLGAGAASVTFHVAVTDANAGNDIVLRLDHPESGTEIGRMTVTSTGDWNTFLEQTTGLTGATGLHDLYITVTAHGTTNLDKFVFSTVQATAAAHGALRGVLPEPAVAQDVHCNHPGCSPAGAFGVLFARPWATSLNHLGLPGVLDERDDSHGTPAVGALQWVYLKYQVFTPFSCVGTSRYAHPSCSIGAVIRATQVRFRRLFLPARSLAQEPKHGRDAANHHRSETASVGLGRYCRLHTRQLLGDHTHFLCQQLLYRTGVVVRDIAQYFAGCH